ncbi:hypothetical protein [Mycobacterium sp.]|uniref:hypothetical protein n=1 Tax=Mycobacterium sp. TaxID=1785 RepID=UPI003F96EA9D
MINPFAHDTTSNAQTDHSFDTDKGIPNEHLVSFMRAMDAPRDSLAEDDYRYPREGFGRDEPVSDTTQPAPPQPYPISNQYRPGYYPKGFSP